MHMQLNQGYGAQLMRIDSDIYCIIIIIIGHPSWQVLNNPWLASALVSVSPVMYVYIYIYLNICN